MKTRFLSQALLFLALTPVALAPVHAQDVVGPGSILMELDSLGFLDESPPSGDAGKKVSARSSTTGREAGTNARAGDGRMMTVKLAPKTPDGFVAEPKATN